MISVITGDIINSRKAYAPGDLLNDLKKELNRHGDTPKDWEIYRGDSFQLEIKNPLDALEIALKLKVIVKKHKGLDVRMAIGIGNKAYDADNVTQSNGDAYVYSGTTLDFTLDKDFTLAIKSNWKEFDRKINLLLKLALSFMNNWTEKTAETIETYFDNPGKSQKEIGLILGKGQSTISERLDRGKVHLVQEIIEEYKLDLKRLLNH